MLCFILHARLRVHLASGIPCALFTKGVREILGIPRARGAARLRSRVCSSPPTRARSARRGGVGGGGCFSKFASSVTREDTPTPDPSPQRARARRGRGE